MKFSKNLDFLPFLRDFWDEKFGILAKVKLKVKFNELIGV